MGIAMEGTGARATIRPSVAMSIAMEAVCLLLEEDKGWDSARKVLAYPDLVEKLTMLEKENVPDRTRKAVRRHLSNPDFNEEKMAKTSPVARALCLWVLAIENFAKTTEALIPRQVNGTKVEKALSKAQKDVEQKQFFVASCESKTESLNVALLEAQNEVVILEKEASTFGDRTARAARLELSLGAEQDVWEQFLVQVEAKAPRAVGDAILAAGCLEYLGPLDSTNREEFKRKALAMFRDAGVLGKRRRAKATIKKLLVAEAWILNPKAGKPKPPGTPTGRGAAGAPPTPTSLAPNEDAEGGGGGASGLKRTLPTPSEGALPTASEGAGGRRGGIKFIGATIAGAEAPARDVPAEVVEPVDDGINLAAAQGFSEDQVRDWHMNSNLPLDKGTVESAVIASRLSRWPLLVDPKGHAARWVCGAVGGANLRVMSASDPNLALAVATAWDAGAVVLVEDVSDPPGQTIAFLLTTHPADQRVFVTDSEESNAHQDVQEEDEEENYGGETPTRLYFTLRRAPAPGTRLAGPLGKAAAVFFSAEAWREQTQGTYKSAQELVLAELVRKTHPTLQPLWRKLETSLSLDRAQLQATLPSHPHNTGATDLGPNLRYFFCRGGGALEHKDKVVRQLIEASDQGAFLDNEPLAETLQQSKFFLAVLMRRRADAEKEADTLRETDPACSMTVSRMAAIAANTLASAEKEGAPASSADIMRQGFRYLARGLQAERRFAFGLLLIAGVALDAGELSPNAWHLFLSINAGELSPARPPSASLDPGEAPAAEGLASSISRVASQESVPEPVAAEDEGSWGGPDFVTREQWRLCGEAEVATAGARPAGRLAGLQTSLLKSALWKTWVCAGDGAADRPPPLQGAAASSSSSQGVQSSAGPDALAGAFARLLLARIFRPDQVSACVQEVLSVTMGPELAWRETGVADMFLETSPFVPVLLIVQPGCDPTADLQILANRHGHSATFTTAAEDISVREGTALDQFFLSAARQGNWAVIADCHLAGEGVLGRILAALLEVGDGGVGGSRVGTPLPGQAASSGLLAIVEPNFRLWLVTEAALSAVGKVPEAVLESLGHERWAAQRESVMWRPLLLSLAAFHATLVQRGRFGTLGWTACYRFGDAELQTTADILGALIDKTPPAGLRALRYSVVQMVYGGRIAAPADRRTLLHAAELSFGDAGAAHRATSPSGGGNGSPDGGGGGDGAVAFYIQAIPPSAGQVGRHVRSVRPQLEPRQPDEAKTPGKGLLSPEMLNAKHFGGFEEVIEAVLALPHDASPTALGLPAAAGGKEHHE
ncbi:hypothetical protein T484DRAFT_1776612, partial [Baffinella frigidus]